MHMHDVIVAMIMWKETRERSPSLGTRVLPRTYIWNVRETCYDAGVTLGLHSFLSKCLENLEPYYFVIGPFLKCSES